MYAITYSMRCNPSHCNTRGIVSKYCQYEVLNFADKLHIQYNIPFKLLSVSDTAKYIHKKHLNDEEPIYKAEKINKMCGIKN